MTRIVRNSRRIQVAAMTALAASVLLAAAAPHAAAQTSYTVTDLGIISGAAHSHPLSINDAAALSGTNTPVIRVVGHTVTSKGVDYHAFYWDSATKVMTDIGALPGGVACSGRAVNSKGEAVGDGATATTDVNPRAFYWNTSLGAGKLVPLSQTLNGGPHIGTAAASHACGINDSGTIVGNVYTTNWGTVAVYWQKDGSGTYQCHELPGIVSGAINNGTGAENVNTGGDISGTVPDSNGLGRVVIWKNAGTASSPIYGTPLDSGAGDSWGSLVNSTGQIASNYNASIGGGFFWIPGSSIQDIGNLGYGNTRVYSLNDSGKVTGDSNPLSDGMRHAYLWTPGATDGVTWNPQMKDLGTLGGSQSWGRGINNAGVVVGLSQTQGDKDKHGFRWDSSGIRDLNDSTVTPSRGAFSILGVAIKITDRSNIVGEGTLTKGGWTHAYLLTPR